MDCKILKSVSLAEIKETGKTKHFIGGRQMEKPVSLQIGQYDNDNGFYLFYLNSEGEVMTDTYHETLSGAISQAEWEFEISSRDWIDL